MAHSTADHVFSRRIPGTKQGQLHYCCPPARAEESCIIGSVLQQKAARRLALCFGNLHFTWASGEIRSSPCRLWQKAWMDNYPEAQQKEIVVTRLPWAPGYLSTALALQDLRELNGALVHHTSSKYCVCLKHFGFSHQNTNGDGLGVKFAGSFLLE